MPSEFATLDTSFPNLEGKTTEEKLQSMTDYLYQLLEQLRYTLHNLGTENMNEESLKDIINMSAKAIDLTGYVTFHSLETPGETVIDGGNITANSIHLVKLGNDVTGSFGDENPGYIKDTYIDSTEIRSPTIKAGKFYGAEYHNPYGESTDIYLVMASDQGNWGMQLNKHGSLIDTPIFGVYNGDFGYVSLSGKSHNGVLHSFLSADAETKKTYALDKWVFRDALLGGSNTVWGSSLPGGGTSAPNWSAAEKSANTGRVFFKI